jgi:hypothetical protein
MIADSAQGYFSAEDKMLTTVRSKDAHFHTCMAVVFFTVALLTKTALAALGAAFTLRVATGRTAAEEKAIAVQDIVFNLI